jgi:hypothetical protein
MIHGNGPKIIILLENMQKDCLHNVLLGYLGRNKKILRNFKKQKWTARPTLDIHHFMHSPT